MVDQTLKITEITVVSFIIFTMVAWTIVLIFINSYSHMLDYEFA